MARLPLLPLLLAVCGLQLAAAKHTHQEFFSAPSAAGHEGECQDNKAGKSAKLGETWTTTGCRLATCVLRPDRFGKMTLSITEDWCPEIERKPGCRQTGQSRTKPFPDCCPKLQCLSTTGGKVVTIPGGSRAPSSSSSPSHSSGRRTPSRSVGQSAGSGRRSFPRYTGRT